jgi:hypothetical protein
MTIAQNSLLILKKEIILGLLCHESRVQYVTQTLFGAKQTDKIRKCLFPNASNQAICTTYILDVLWCQPIKLIHVVSTSEFHEY